MFSKTLVITAQLQLKFLIHSNVACYVQSLKVISNMSVFERQQEIAYRI